jgi:cytochrome c
MRLALALLLLAALPARASEAVPGQETVETLCIACHSIAIVAQQRLSRSVWDEVMVWMVEEQGMPALDEDELAAVLDYLTENYGPDVPR